MQRNGGSIGGHGLGGYVDLATSWSDIDQNVHPLGSDDLVPTRLKVRSSWVSFDGQSWMVDVCAVNSEACSLKACPLTVNS